MDSLEEFEKHLAEEKEARKKKRHHEHRDGTSGHRKHRHHHHHRHADDRPKHSSRDSHEKESDSHREKRAKFLEDEDKEIVRKRTNEKPSRIKKDEDHKVYPDDKSPESDATQLKRDTWMEDPSAIDFDFIQIRSKKLDEAPVIKPDYDLKVHKNELNPHLRAREGGDKTLDNYENLADEITYTFGDSGSQWRMTKLKSVYNQAEQGDKTLDEVAIKLYGDLKSFDDAREEQNELERRSIYGDGYVGKQKPSGELFKQRKIEVDVKEPASTSTHEGMPVTLVPSLQVALDPTLLNRMKAQLMKAKLKNSPDLARLEKEYDEAMSRYSEKFSKSETITLSHMENRMLAGSRDEAKPVNNKRGRQRGLVEYNEDMSVEDMVREERRTRGQAGGEGMRAAERIAKDTRFETDFDYMEENANKLAQRVQKSEINLKNIAVGEYQKMNRILDNCQLCHHEDKNQPPVAPIISLATRVFLTLPTEPELSEYGAVIVPLQHRLNLLECDDDEWEEIRNFMKSLTRMYHDQGRDVIFYENASDLHRKKHAALHVVPLPYSLGEIAPAFFKEAILSSDEEWAQHKKLLDTAADARRGLGKHAFRRKFTKELPYFHVWFDINGGLGHIVEDTRRWPKGDLFAREVIGGMLEIDSEIIRKQGRWSQHDKRLPAFKLRWQKFDWTRVLTDA